MRFIASVEGPVAAGRPLCKCPPADACGDGLLLYFARSLPAATGLGLRQAGKADGTVRRRWGECGAAVPLWAN